VCKSESDTATRRSDVLLLPPIVKRNHNKNTRERDFPKRVQISVRILLIEHKRRENIKGMENS
jgi:hypothetical protein